MPLIAQVPTPVRRRLIWFCAKMLFRIVTLDSTAVFACQSPCVLLVMVALAIVPLGTAPHRKTPDPVPVLLAIVELKMPNGVLPMLITCSTALSCTLEPFMVNADAALEKMTLLALGPLLPKNSSRLRTSDPLLLNSSAVAFSPVPLPPPV